jgi:uncharacterized membrane protein YbhN (UPF0104 family)
MPSSRTRALVLLGSLLVLASFAVPMALGIHFQLLGLAEAAAGSVLLVSCSTLALNGSRPVSMSTRRAVPTVLATTAANAVTPGGIGGALLTMRVHRQSGLTTEQATAAAALRTTVGAFTATTITAVVASTIGMRSLPSSSTMMWVALAVVVAVAAAVTAMPKTRTRFLTSVRGTGAAMVDVLRRPRCLVALVVGCVGVTVAQLMTLMGAVHAVGGHLSWSHLLVALLGSAAARSALPSPGGVGPIEAALVGGLTALGLGWGSATAAVAVYRTAGHWLPVLAGVLSIRELRRRQLL